jgi:hypothetical protein
MAKKTTTKTPGGKQPKPFTPGVSAGEVRDNAYRMFRVKLEKGESLTTEDWVKAEKDLVRERDEAEA